MSVVALGLDHRTAPLDQRARFGFPAERLAATLRGFRAQIAPADEVAIVSTCNRTEVYVGGEQPQAAAAQTLAWLAQAGGQDVAAVRPHCYVLHDEAAARHAFRLASGLSSMVVGETQILGQLKVAVREAGSAGTLGTTLHQLFQRSFAVAKEVRSDTAIGRHTVGLGAAVVHLAEQLFEGFATLRVLLLGAGEMAGPVLQHLAARAPRQLTVANRDLARAQALALPAGAEAVGLAAALARLAEFDVVVACTASPLPIVGLGAAERAIQARRRRPMLMVDLGVPRNIEPGIGVLDDVYLHSIDDLAAIVRAGGQRREAAVGEAETIVEHGVQDFVRWQAQRQAVPLICALQAQADAWRAGEVQRARKRLARGDDIDAVLEALSHGLTQKMLHGPLAGLHHLQGAERGALSATLERLFLRCPATPRA